MGYPYEGGGSGGGGGGGGGGSSSVSGVDGPTGTGGGGASTSPGPTLPAPGHAMFGDVPYSLGAAETAGRRGVRVVIPEIPGDLGSQYADLNEILLMAESHRALGSFNGMSSVNHRYRGHREANKFNLIIQKVASLCSRLFLQLRSSNNTLKTRESASMYPTDTEITLIYYIQSQIAFKEWLLLKDDNIKWFN